MIADRVEQEVGCSLLPVNVVPAQSQCFVSDSRWSCGMRNRSWAKETGYVEQKQPINPCWLGWVLYTLALLWPAETQFSYKLSFILASLQSYALFQGVGVYSSLAMLVFVTSSFHWTRLGAVLLILNTRRNCSSDTLTQESKWIKGRQVNNHQRKGWMCKVLFLPFILQPRCNHLGFYFFIFIFKLTSS